LRDADFGLLSDEGERGLTRALSQYPRVVAQAAEVREPHRIAFYAHDLATLFHSHWNRGKDSPHLRFVNDGNASLTNARMGLVAATAFVLASALTILGVSAPEEMR
jgi:arginyl-tRNA synthetase